MSNKSNPAVIGAFVLGAIGLLVAAVILFGGSELLASRFYVVSYFPGSVKGLRVGSNVSFRGVRVGYVTDINVVTDAEKGKFDIPVTYRILRESFKVVEGDRITDMRESPGRLSHLIQQGLRAKLESESFVTGQLEIQLDFMPEAPAVFRGHKPPHPEIPSAPSTIQAAIEGAQKTWASLQQKIDAEKLLADIQGIVSGLNRLANAPELASILAGVDKLANSADTQALPADLRGAASSLTATVQDAQRVVDKLDHGVTPLMTDAHHALESLNVAVEQATSVLQHVDHHVGDGGDLSYELKRTLEEAQRTARSLRVLMEYLDQQPQSIIRGKPDQESSK
jgi:paraquat-inducible protein B